MILASQFRIKDKSRVEEVKSKGKLIQSENFGVAFLEKTGEENPRFAFVISSKISKLAVHRNRINRSMHEGSRRALNRVPKNFDYVFLAKRSISGRSTDEIIKEVGRLFDNLKVKI